MNSIRVNFIWTLLGQLMEKGAPFFVSVLLVRDFNAKDYTEYALLAISVISLAALSSTGIQIAATKFARHSKDGDQQAAAILSQLQRFAIIQSFAFIVIALFSASLWYPQAQILDSFVLIIASLGISLSAIPNAKLVAMRKFKDLSLISICGGMIVLGGTILSVAFQSIAAAKLSLAISAVVTMISAWVLSKRSFIDSSLEKNLFRRVKLSTALRETTPLAASAAITALTNLAFARLFLSGSNGSPESFAAFSIGMQWFSLAQFIPSIVNRVTFPDILSSGKLKQNDSRTSSEPYKQAMKFSVIAALITSVLIGLFSAPLAGLYGATYITPFTIIVFASISAVSAPINIYGNVLIAESKQWHWFINTLLWALILLTTAYFSSALGVFGAAIALWISSIVQLFIARLLIRTY